MNFHGVCKCTRLLLIIKYDHSVNIISLQKLQDWKLLLLAIVIISIEITYTVPLLAIIYINGDTRIVLDERNPPSVNVIYC